MSNHRQPPPGQLPGQLNIFQAAESMGAAEALRQAAQALDAAAEKLTIAADMFVTLAMMGALPPGTQDNAYLTAASAARTAANQARQEADR